MLLNWIQAKVKHATWIPPLIAHTWEAVDQRWINQWIVLGQWDSHVEKKKQSELICNATQQRTLKMDEKFEHKIIKHKCMWENMRGFFSSIL